ncbi:hypothetical protein J1614_002436 [Plenodomus biglobosus]|nr:hypothetical protein J1614_002436 [Plenodomus biglobosus]
MISFRFLTNSGVISVTSTDMRCFQNKAGTGTATVAAGVTLGFVATTSISHFGPVQFYMAKVPDNADINTWEAAGNVWFKAASISAVGSPLTSSESTWPAYRTSLPDIRTSDVTSTDTRYRENSGRVRHSQGDSKR